MHPEQSNTLPSVSFVIEWENAALSETERSKAMLEQLHQQIGELEDEFRARPEIILLYERTRIDGAMIKSCIAGVADETAWPADIRVIPTTDRAYYEQKNLGASHAKNDVIIFLDSDVIPEPGWLRGLVETFRNPEISVTCGNTYIDCRNLYSKAFALFWFFPLREEGNELVPADQFFANNVAFRRDVFQKYLFPDSEQFRGQCVTLAGWLKQDGIGIHIQQSSRVSHPPPNGLRHFVVRALCAGYDAKTTCSLHGRASILSALEEYARDMYRSLSGVYKGYRRVRLTATGAVGALTIAGSYYTLKFAGFLVTLVNPGLIRRNLHI